MAEALIAPHSAIRLTFVPNQYCNLGCSYCYLGELTEIREDNSDVVANFRRIADHLARDGVLIDALLLHGAEVSTLPEPILRELFEAYRTYREHWRQELKALGQPGRARIHIKTNLYNFHRLRPLFEEHRVSVSGSVDLPFSLHEKLRVTKAGKSTLKRTIDNVLLLRDYPHTSQISCVIGTEHLERFDEFVADLEWLDEQGYDMATGFYIMFAYDSVNVDYRSQLTDAEMVEFLERLIEHFRGTKFEKAIYYEWFKEFTHDYCTNQINCGSNNFLVQKNGDVYPCHRGQAEPKLKFGNIHNLGMPELVQRGVATIREYERENEPLSAECIGCEWFHLCYAGCPIERNNTRGNRSYTCGVQKTLYKAQPHRFPPRPDLSRRMVDEFIRQNQPRIYDDLSVPRIARFNPEILDPDNAITALIARDEKLQTLFRPGAVSLSINGEHKELFSGQLYGRMMQASISRGDEVNLHIDDDLWALNAPEGAINAVKLQFLRDNPVVYGDEQRTKMEHVATIDLYPAELERTGTGWAVDLAPVLERHAHTFLPDYGNLLSVTTLRAREYHYAKHARNAFYHLETINLPFHEFRFDYR